MDTQQILAALPHRYPFLMVDRVVERTAERIVAIKNVSINEPFFQGHFPGHPVMPGVLIVEALAQAGALLACQGTHYDPEKHVVYFMSIDKAKFRKPVRPGDQLLLEATVLRGGGKIWKLRGEAKVQGEIVAEAEFLATMADR